MENILERIRELKTQIEKDIDLNKKAYYILLRDIFEKYEFMFDEYDVENNCYKMFTEFDLIINYHDKENKKISAYGTGNRLYYGISDLYIYEITNILIAVRDKLETYDIDNEYIDEIDRRILADEISKIDLVKYIEMMILFSKEEIEFIFDDYSIIYDSRCETLEKLNVKMKHKLRSIHDYNYDFVFKMSIDVLNKMKEYYEKREEM